MSLALEGGQNDCEDIGNICGVVVGLCVSE